METLSSVASSAVECYANGDFDGYSAWLQDLELTLDGRPEAVRQLLVGAGLPKLLLERAAEVVAAGDSKSAQSMRLHAESLVGEKGVAVLIEEHRIYIGRSLPTGEVNPARHTGFATI